MKPKKKIFSDDDEDLADDETVHAKGSATAASSTAESSKTPKTTVTMAGTSPGRMEEKELHTKIEELDKRGKAFFKSKQVGFFGTDWLLSLRLWMASAIGRATVNECMNPSMFKVS